MHIVEVPLALENQHAFIHLQGQRWLLDTGSPKSFGCFEHLSLGGLDFTLPDSYLDLTVESLSEQVHTACAGLLGADILNQFDHLFDLPQASLKLSREPLHCEGQKLPCRMFLGIPVITATVAGQACPLLFDTGSRLSYLNSALLADQPQVAESQDFYPGLGNFQVSLHAVTLNLGNHLLALQCARLPELLELVLQMADAKGFLGNEMLSRFRTGYFPRRQLLVLSNT